MLSPQLQSKPGFCDFSSFVAFFCGSRAKINHRGGARRTHAQVGSGDDTRAWGPPFIGSESVYFLSVNRNKKSIAVNMKHPDGAKVVRKLACVSDVLVENFLPGKLTELGLGPEQLRAENPRLIYCSISEHSRALVPGQKKPCLPSKPVWRMAHDVSDFSRTHVSVFSCPALTMFGLIVLLMDYFCVSWSKFTKPTSVVLDKEAEHVLSRQKPLETRPYALLRMSSQLCAGYGQSGPSSLKPGYDSILSAVSGMMHITGPEGGEPVRPGVAMTDLATGLYAHGAVMAALLQRHKTGTGTHIDCNLLSSQPPGQTLADRVNERVPGSDRGGADSCERDVPREEREKRGRRERREKRGREREKRERGRGRSEREREGGERKEREEREREREREIRERERKIKRREREKRKGERREREKEYKERERRERKNIRERERRERKKYKRERGERGERKKERERKRERKNIKRERREKREKEYKEREREREKRKNIKRERGERERETCVSCLSHIAANFLNSGKEAKRWGTAHESIVPYQWSYETRTQDQSRLRPRPEQDQTQDQRDSQQSRTRPKTRAGLSSSDLQRSLSLQLYPTGIIFTHAKLVPRDSDPEPELDQSRTGPGR
ncbi:hypothetical protein WMY93_032971 [Mugilogobius chulae]|uniref:Succinyl-CoA:glutarate-CoA transferase n=1 Tax=Mugilogobius chulae TaxID=88201 RepID=A0AAW0MUS6_9GOBI